MTPKRSPEKKPSGGLRFLHLGDSYTCAEGIPAGEGWTARIASGLRKEGVRVAAQRIVARTGWTSGELLAAMRDSEPGGPYDLVTLCTGANDQYRGLGHETFRENLERILEFLVPPLLPGPGRAVLLSIPDWSVSPFASGRDRKRIALEIDAFNNVVRETARAFDLPFVNWTPLTRSFAGKEDAFAADGLHPSGSQQAAWAEFLHESLFSTRSGILKSSMMR